MARRRPGRKPQRQAKKRPRRSSLAPRRVIDAGIPAGIVTESGPAAPVRIVKDQTRITNGTEVQEKMIAAARVFSDILRPTFGPRGLDKMLYKTDGSMAVTNDGARIVAELLVKHPAARMMVSMGKTQEEMSGDGVTATMLICGALLEEATRLLSRGLHPLTVVDGYRKSLAISSSVVNARSRDVSDGDLSKIATTSMTGKSVDAPHFSPILSEAFRILRPNVPEVSTENFGMHKTGQGSQRDSRLVQGLVLRRRVPSENAPNNLKEAPVAVIRGDLKIRKMTRLAEIKITDSEQLDSFIAEEQNRKEKIVQSISQSGARLVLCGGEVDRDILHSLTNSEILVISELDSSEIEQAALATNARVIDGIMDIDTEMLGQCGSVEWIRKPPSDQVEDIVTIDGCPLAKLVTISVSGTSDTASEETIRCLHDAIRSISACETDPRVVVGAGSIHARIAHGVRSASLSEPGRERLAMDAFARAMECIPFALASNAGAEGLDTVLEIRTKSRDEVKREYGVTEQGEVKEIEDVLHPSSAILSSIEAALETAVGMLRIDQVVSARGD